MHVLRKRTHNRQHLRAIVVIIAIIGATIAASLTHVRPARAQIEPLPAPTSSLEAKGATPVSAAFDAPTPTLDLGPLFSEPVLHGAWLWQANCVRCHGQYGEERVGEEMKSKDLQHKISGSDRNSCSLSWSITRGGPLSIAEIRSIVAYVEAWEKKGAEPSLAPMLPIPAPTSRPTLTSAATPEIATATPAPTIDPALGALLAQDPVYEGAWLYAENCVICHLSYDRARQASTVDDETMRGLITNGKVASSMPSFGILNGGNLKRAQVNAIVSYMRTWENLGRNPDLPEPIAQHLAERTKIALAMPTMVGAPPAFAPTPAASRAVASRSASDAARGGGDSLWGIFMLLSVIGVVGGAGLFAGAVACTAIHPPKRNS